MNVDLSRAFETGVFYFPLNVSAGLEYRVEEFEVEAGHEYAWYISEEGASQGFTPGSNGFVGFLPEIEGVKDQGSYAAYLDLEADVVEDVLLGAALENFEGVVGDSLNGKLAARWQMMNNVALRSSISTGFRAPTVGQADIFNVTTQINDQTGKLENVGTVPVAELAGTVTCRTFAPLWAPPTSRGLGIFMARLRY